MPAWINKLIDDWFSSGQEKCCDKHDFCYGRRIIGNTQHVCDSKFYKCLKDAAPNKTWMNWGMYSLVRMAGAGAFKSAQTKRKWCCPEELATCPKCQATKDKNVLHCTGFKNPNNGVINTKAEIYNMTTLQLLMD